MSQCVPTWCSSSDHEVAELTWENGQLAMHGLVPPRVSHKPLPSSWEKPRAGGTLESIVDQAAAAAASSSAPKAKSPSAVAALAGADILVPWLFEGAEALVPCSIQPNDPLAAAAAAADSSPPVSAGEGTKSEKAGLRAAREKSVDVRGRCIPERSVTGSAATFGGNSTRPVTVDACETGFTSTTSPGNTITTTAAADHHSFSQAKPQTSCDEKGKKAKRKSSVSTKRSCAAAIHNQSERKRRDKINQRMKTLQKLVPNSSKTDKASMLDEVIDYLKQLQAQVQMMGRMNMSPMMLPMAMQGQLQMPIMAPTGVNMGMGMGIGMNLMDMNALGCAHVHRQIPPLLHPAALMPQTSRDGFGGDRVPMTIMLDPIFAYVNCQSQPMTLDAYSRMAALYQQLHQPPPSSSKV